jgi:hypothetical protein
MLSVLGKGWGIGDWSFLREKILTEQMLKLHFHKIINYQGKK